MPRQHERATLSYVSRVHEVLRWANRRAVAEEVTRRGYRVSGETLNRWVRDEKEFPAVVERIVFELFGIGQQETAAPEWAAAMSAKVDAIYEQQTIVADQAVTRLTRILSVGDSEKMGILREALADALEQTGPSLPPELEPHDPTGEGVEPGAPPPPPSSSNAARDG